MLSGEIEFVVRDRQEQEHDRSAQCRMDIPGGDALKMPLTPGDLVPVLPRDPDAFPAHERVHNLPDLFKPGKAPSCRWIPEHSRVIFSQCR
jgi:hypothetical protein